MNSVWGLIFSFGRGGAKAPMSMPGYSLYTGYSEGKQSRNNNAALQPFR